MALTKMSLANRIIKKKALKEARRLEFLEHAIRVYRAKMDRFFIADYLLEATGQEKSRTLSDLEGKSQNKTKKLAKQIRDNAVKHKFGAIKAEDCD
jgi:hypothetical protein